MGRFTFKNGIHPDGNKHISRYIPTTFLETPKMVYISMSQHIGAPANPIVKVGDRVLVGTLIGEASGFMSANVYSSVAGTVIGIQRRVTPTGAYAQHITIENDFTYEKKLLDDIPNLDRIDSNTIVERVKLAGIVGMGGATFPTHIKLRPSKPVDVLIINGAECEPYITCDYRLMIEKSSELIAGIKLIMMALGVGQAYIGIEKNKQEAIERLSKLVPANIKIVQLETKYPQGAEKQLIYAVTKRKVTAGGLPMDVGVVVDNVQTAYAINRAVYHNEPLYMRILTVSGLGVDKPGNLWVRTGVSYEDIYKAQSYDGQGAEHHHNKIISGGPMMGFAQPNLNATVGKGSSALLFLTNEEINVKPISTCINCCRCRKVCPNNLMPMMFERLVSNNDYEMAKRYNIMNCMECGSCTFACPAGRHIIQSIRLGKKILRESNK